MLFGPRAMNKTTVFLILSVGGRREQVTFRSRWA